jgi:hypothetical protein
MPERYNQETTPARRTAESCCLFLPNIVSFPLQSMLDRPTFRHLQIPGRWSRFCLLSLFAFFLWTGIISRQNYQNPDHTESRPQQIAEQDFCITSPVAKQGNESHGRPFAKVEVPSFNTIVAPGRTLAASAVTRLPYDAYLPTRLVYTLTTSSGL